MAVSKKPGPSSTRRQEPIGHLKPGPSSTRRQEPIGLLAMGSSGPWQIDIDETTSGTNRWFAQIEGPSTYLYFEISSLAIIDEARKFLTGSRNKNGRNAAPIPRDGTLALGTSKATSVSLVRDDEFSDRYFLTIEPKGGLVLRFTLAGDDLAHILDALHQVMEDLP